MKKKGLRTGAFVVVILILCAATAFSAYHHEGERDSANFSQVYPDKAGTKLDQCALCHSGGKYEKSEGKFTSLGSCQWCHYSYGYDAKGNILDTMNAYGKAYHDNGRNADAVKKSKMRILTETVSATKRKSQPCAFPEMRAMIRTKKQPRSAFIPKPSWRQCLSIPSFC